MPMTTSTQTQPHILLVEDDVFVRPVYEMKLKSAGYTVVSLAAGDAVLPYLAEHIPALILLDLLLPGQTGFEILEAIRNDARLAGVPIVVLSNLGQESDIGEAKRLGATDYLVKMNRSLYTLLTIVARHVAAK